MQREVFKPSATHHLRLVNAILGGNDAARLQTDPIEAVPTLLNAESRSIHGRVCFSESRWQGEVEPRTRRFVAVGPNPTAV
jgi:hypothetical protein